MSIVDVARKAGVSCATVSRVINNNPSVGADAVSAVRAAMEALQYTPSDRRPGPKPGARAVPKVTTVALMVLGTHRDRATPAFEQLMRGVSNGVADWGARLVYLDIADPAALPKDVTETHFDGLLLYGVLPPAATRDALRKYPTVWLMANRRRPDWGDQVMPDTYEIGDKAARYLIDRGHKRLAFLNLDQNHWPFRVSAESFCVAAADRGVACDMLESPRAADGPPFPPSAADALAERFLRLSPRPTGLFVADDLQVAIVQPALQRAGVAFGPGGVEVISCNNERPYLIGLQPTPAEIDLQVETVGYRGVERLLWRLAHRDLTERVVTAVEPTVIDHDGQAFAFTTGR